MKNFLFINPPWLTHSTAQGRECCTIDSKRLDQLRRDPSRLLQFAKTIFLLEYTKLVDIHSAKQSAINRAHDLGSDHRSPIFIRKQRRCTSKKLACAPCFELHQANELLVILSILQVCFGVIE